MRTVRVFKLVLAAVLRIVLGTAIAVGIIQSLESFPYSTIASWQAGLNSASIDFPRAAGFFWFANHWLELSVTIGLIQLSRLTWALSRIEA